MLDKALMRKPSSGKSNKIPMHYHWSSHRDLHWISITHSPMKNHDQSMLNNEEDCFLATTTQSALGTFCGLLWSTPSQVHHEKWRGIKWNEVTSTILPRWPKHGNASPKSLNFPKDKSKKTPSLTVEHIKWKGNTRRHGIPSSSIFATFVIKYKEIAHPWCLQSSHYWWIQLLGKVACLYSVDVSRTDRIVRYETHLGQNSRLVRRPQMPLHILLTYASTCWMTFWAVEQHKAAT